MATLADVFQELNNLKAEGAVREYALGGATAVLFYTEPSRTYDVDVFVLLAPATSSGSEPLKGIYAWARKRGFAEEAEHILIRGVPVQFLPAHNALAEEAVVHARTLDYDGVPESLKAISDSLKNFPAPTRREPHSKRRAPIFRKPLKWCCKPTGNSSRMPQLAAR